MVLQLSRVHSILRVVGRVLVQVRHEDGLAVGRLDVLPRAAIAVSTSADFEVERAVDFVELCAENGGEEISHLDALCGWCVNEMRWYGLDEVGCSKKVLFSRGKVDGASSQPRIAESRVWLICQPRLENQRRLFPLNSVTFFGIA